VRERVAAHVHEHEQIRPERAGGLGDPFRQSLRPERRVHEHRLLAEQRGHPRLGEQHAAPAHARLAGGGQDARGEPARPLDLGLGTRAGLRVDRPPLPADAAHDRVRSVCAARLCRGERAHHVAAPAYAEHERPPGGGEQSVGVDHEDSARAIDCG
jgi:hypothetical protein